MRLTPNDRDHLRALAMRSRSPLAAHLLMALDYIEEVDPDPRPKCRCGHVRGAHVNGRCRGAVGGAITACDCRSFRAQLMLAAPCPHPHRKGIHETYIHGDLLQCHACGATGEASEFIPLLRRAT